MFIDKMREFDYDHGQLQLCKQLGINLRSLGCCTAFYLRPPASRPDVPTPSLYIEGEWYQAPVDICEWNQLEYIKRILNGYIELYKEWNERTAKS